MAVTTLAEEICDYLEDTHSIGTKGTDLFYNFMPDLATSPMAAIKATGGPQPYQYQPIATTALQVLVRASASSTDAASDVALEFAGKIHNVLHGLWDTALTNNHVVSSLAMGQPGIIGPDKNGRILVSANYEVETYAISDSGEASTGVGHDKTPNLNT